VRALTSSFVCGGDDYLLILFDGNSHVRAITSPAAALAAAAAAIAALLPWESVHALLLTHALRPWPSQAVDCCLMRAALGSWGGVQQVANSEVAFCHSFSCSCALCCFALSCCVRTESVDCTVVLYWL
jgi:hypothetical protein